jgi:hypothetical protein
VATLEALRAFPETEFRLALGWRVGRRFVSRIRLPLFFFSCFDYNLIIISATTSSSAEGSQTSPMLCRKTVS